MIPKFWILKHLSVPLWLFQVEEQWKCHFPYMNVHTCASFDVPACFSSGVNGISDEWLLV